jgi:hypothetical protein
MTLLAFGRPFLPLFLHILGAMTLWGALLTAVIAAVAGQRRATVVSLVVAVPAWVLTLACAYWIESKEGLGSSNATWLGIGHMVLEPGLVILLVALVAARRWNQSGGVVAGRIATWLSGVYLLLLTVAMLAMSGKWG